MDDFATVQPGRRLTFTYPNLPSLRSSLTPSVDTDDTREDNRVAPDVAIFESAKYVVTVLDVPAGRPSPSYLCAAIIAPDKEVGSPGQWIYTSAGGQWELLASADVARLVVIQRGRLPQVRDFNSETPFPPPDQDPVAVCPLSEPESGPEHGPEPEPELKSRISKPLENSLCERLADTSGPVTPNATIEEELQSLIWSLAPAACFESKSPIPFLKYVSDVRQRVVVAQAESALTGLMVVEDVEVGFGDDDDDDEEGAELYGPGDTSKVNESNSFDTRSKDSHPLGLKFVSGEKSTRLDLPPGSHLAKRVMYRRRLRFESMPNLIQSEVPLLFYESSAGGWNFSSPQKRRKLDPSPVSGSSVCRGAETIDRNVGKSSGRDTGKYIGKSVGKNLDGSATSGALRFADVARGPDLSHLVHKYLPPIVAGLGLIGRSLEREIERQRKPKVLVLGGGAFTLPMFLRNQFPFRVEVVEVDRVVVCLAKKYFGLVEDSNLKVKVGDAHDFVVERAKKVGVGDGVKIGRKGKTRNVNVGKNGDIHGRGEIGRNSENDENEKNGQNNKIGENGKNLNFDDTNIEKPREEVRVVIDVSSSADGFECDRHTPLEAGGEKYSPSPLSSSECDIDTESDTFSSPSDSSRSDCESGGECEKKSCEFGDVGGRRNVCNDTSSARNGDPHDNGNDGEHSGRNLEDLQYSFVVLDVDVSDGKLGLSSPPPQFLSTHFLSQIKRILRKDGLLAINVVPLSENAYLDACRSIKEVFEELWEIRVDRDANRILFALQEVSGDRKALSLAGAQFAQSDWLLESIWKL